MGFVRTFRACRSLFRIKMAETFSYRVSALTGAMIGVFWGILECVMYTVFFKYSSNASAGGNGMTLSQTISYVWLAEGFLFLNLGNIDGDIMAKINSGDIGTELCRPLDLYFHWFSKTAAGKLGMGWIRCALTLTAAALMPADYALKGPASAKAAALFLLSVSAALFISTAYGMLLTAIRLNVTWGNGPVYMVGLAAMILSGSYLPLRLWPDFMQGFLRLQPFAGATDTPMQIYVGSLTPAEALPAIAVQAAWTAIFIAAGRILMGIRLKTIVIQGS